MLIGSGVVNGEVYTNKAVAVDNESELAISTTVEAEEGQYIRTDIYGRYHINTANI